MSDKKNSALKFQKQFVHFVHLLRLNKYLVVDTLIFFSFFSLFICDTVTFILSRSNYGWWIYVFDDSKAQQQLLKNKQATLDKSGKVIKPAANATPRYRYFFCLVFVSIKWKSNFTDQVYPVRNTLFFSLSRYVLLEKSWNWKFNSILRFSEPIYFYLNWIYVLLLVVVVHSAVLHNRIILQSSHLIRSGKLHIIHNTTVCVECIVNNV